MNVDAQSVGREVAGRVEGMVIDEFVGMGHLGAFYL